MNKHLKALSIAASAILAISFQTSAQTVEDGLKHLDAEQYNAAGKIFKQLVQTTPTAENYFYEGYYYLNLPEPKLDSAKIFFEKGAALDQKRPDPFCRVGLGAVKLGMNDRAGAKAEFDAVTKDTKGKNPDVLYRIGEAYVLFNDPNGINVNDPAEAVRNIELAQARKQDAAYNLVVARAYLIKNDGGPAMTNLETALPKAKNPALVKTIMGKVWVQGKNYQKALDYYNDAVKTDPSFAPVYRNLGEFYVLYGKYQLAAENYRKYLELADTDDAAKLRYVKFAFTAKDYPNALRVLDEIKDRIKDPIKYRLMGFANFESGKPEVAIPQINTWLQQAGKDVVTGKDRVLGMDYGYLGRSFAALKEPGKEKINDSLAIMNMQKAIAMEDTSYNYYADIAKIQMANKDYKAATATYKQMIAASKKESASDYSLLGQALYYDGARTKDTTTLAESERVWAKVADYYKEKYPIAAYFQGNSRRQIEGETPTGKVIPAFEKYLTYLGAEKSKNKARVVDVCNYIGQVSLFKQDTATAIEYFKKTLEVDPSNALATDALAKLNGSTTTTTPAATTPVKNK